MANNAPWTFEELVLALDLLDRRGWYGWNTRKPEVIELSALLRSANFPRLDAIDESFRSVNSVSLKLGNLKGANPAFDGGLRSTQHEADVIEYFTANADVMRSLAESLRQGIGASSPSDIKVGALDEEEATAAIEGGPKYVLALRRERSRKLRSAKLRQVEQDGGAIACEVCGFDFFSTYGELGRSYIEVHHRTPLHVSGQTDSYLDDLALLCANCHRMVHRSGWMRVEDLLTVVHL